MNRESKTKEELVKELAEMVQRVAKLEVQQTQHKQTDRELREGDERHRRLLELFPEAVAVHSKGRIVYINAAGAKMLGVTSPEKLIGKSVVDFVHPDYQEIIKKRIRRGLERRKKARLVEEKLVRPDGKVIYVETTATCITYRGEPAMLAVSRDITERKEAEKKIEVYEKRLRSLASELTLIEERERRNLASELHESISQLLALCRIKLGKLEKVTELPDARLLVKEVEEHLEEVIWHTRSLTLRLGPPVLYEFGLEPALEWLAEHMQEQYGIDTKLKVDAEADPRDEELRIFLFRAVQELMTNIAKHTGTDKAKVCKCQGLFPVFR